MKKGKLQNQNNNNSGKGESTSKGILNSIIYFIYWQIFTIAKSQFHILNGLLIKGLLMCAWSVSKRYKYTW